MRRLGYTDFGNADVLSWSEVPTPMPGRDEVLVRTRATTLNATDTKVRSGELKALTILRRKPFGFGMDVAGVVEAVGSGVRDLVIGDRVAGMTSAGDGFAQATIAKASRLVRIPDGVDFEQAAAAAMSGASAVGVVEAMKPARGSHVFVSGGAGGIGQYLLRLLALAGCTVEASGSAVAADILRGLGAVPHDYRALDAAALAGRFDAVVDLSGALHFAEAKPWLRGAGTFYALVPDARIALDEAATLLPGRPKARALVVQANAERLRRVLTFVAAGSIRVRFAGVHPLADAIEVLAGPAPSGKLVFTAPDDATL
ncbi:NADP-dependent oxidoreductase [Microbacteriaceae bacterium VKM Ac-2854]|nr:NADP-dependent oxidoreductase [Microbacteriaceae bacterium VKM Ac-2854]